MVMDYFKDRPQDLLVVTVDEEHPAEPLMDRISEFLGCDGSNRKFPKKNRAGSRGKKKQIDQEALDWKAAFNITGDDEYSIIPYLKGNDRGDLSVHFADKHEFRLDWKLFVVDELHDRIESLLE